MATGYIVWNVLDHKVEAGPFATSAAATTALARVQKTNQGGQAGKAKTVNYTVGYFNPGKTQDPDAFGGGRYNGKSAAEKFSALRVYGPADGTKKDQLACFLGVAGFRDESVKMSKLVRKVTVEQRYVDDGEGNVEYGGKRLAELTMKGEDDETF